MDKELETRLYRAADKLDEVEEFDLADAIREAIQEIEFTSDPRVWETSWS